jgi:hypothetical protein
MRILLVAALVTACGSGHPAGGGGDDVGPDAGTTADAAGDAAGDCAAITDQTSTTVSAGAADDYVLALTGSASSPTSWGEAGNEAVVLEVAGSRGLIGHVILHQGKTAFPYAMHVGALVAGELLTIKVSALSAPNAVRGASVCGAHLTPVTGDPLAEGIANAPIYRWPVQKTFNDVPLLVGWSRAKKSYQTVMTNEDGGTAEQCGGGASGMQAEIARWGRSTDIESHYSYGGAAPSWERCTGRVDVTTTSIRTEGTHPILYYGDGHNRVFENRSGYGATCGTGTPEKPDGDLAGWNTQNPSSAFADDAGKVVILRPVPVDLDALGYAQFGGRREGLADHYAPWMYRVASLELARENKIDNSKAFGMARYLYVDVRISDVGGSGDSHCTLTVSGGFKLRAVTTGGTEISSGQMTSDFTGTGHDWKRVAIALPAGVAAADIDHFVFDAYDNDGIYLTAIGDAFIAVPDGPNGATIEYVRQGTRPLAYYVDDGSSGCANGTNSSGPGGTPYDCAGGQVTVAK